MVLASMYENRNRRRHIAQGREEGLEQGRKEGKAIGRAAAHSAWRDWLRRKEIAVANGQPFTKPTPGTNRNGNSGSSAPPSQQP